MRSMQKFAGINNVQPPEQIKASELSVASNVDIDVTGSVTRRNGYARVSALKHSNVFDGSLSLAARGAAGDLVNLDTDAVLRAALGHTRIWYCQLPDGRVAFSNGTATGIASAASVTAWGVPIPAGIGAAADVAGDLFPGKYQWSVTHVRLADGLEGGPAYSGAGALDVALGGVSFTGIPVPAGYKSRVYLTSHFGGERFFAGESTDGTFAFTGKNSDLVRPCRTEFMQPAPVGKLLAFWRGRALVAVGSALFASRPNSWELFDLRRDYKQFSAPLTMVQPVDGGIWVGTQEEFSFLAGDTWDKLVRHVKIPGPVALGSGVTVPGEHVKVSDGRGVVQGDGDCVVCIADGWLVAGTAQGELSPLTIDRYRTDPTAEVMATFRNIDGMPQYIAIPAAA